MAGIFGLLMSGAGVIKDQYFNLTSLLLPGNGTNGAQNNTFLDSGTANSGSGFTITRNGNTTQGTFSPFSQTGWGNYFNGGGSGFLNAVTDTAFAFGTGDFTLEAYLYCTSYPSAGTVRANIISAHNWNGSGFNFTFRLNQTGYLEFEVSSVVTSSSIVPLNTWTHVACVRSSGTITFYINGVASGSGAQSNSLASTTPISIGAALSGGTYGNYTGYISNARIVKDVVVYTGNFTPPIVPLAATQSAGTNISAITGTQTSLLTCQNNRFKDNSTYNFTLTSGSGTSVTPFSPFAPTQSYSAAAVGGSGYFDGTGDYLSIASSSAALPSGTQDYSVEAWVYWGTQSASFPQIITNPATDGFQISYDVSGGTLSIGRYGVASVVSYTVAQSSLANQWTHILATRSGNTHRLFVNGVLRGNAVNSISFASLTTQTIASAGAGNYFVGYISSIRTVLGSIPTTYQTSSTTNGTAIFDPPTAPPTTTSQGSSAPALLLNFTNAGVVDATAKNVLETVGNAQISTTQSKWGGGSISFDGNGDRATMPGSALLALGGGDFTVEGWVYKSANTAYMTLCGNLAVAGENVWQILADVTGNKICWYNGASSSFTITSSATLNTGAWYYIAFVRSGSASNNFKLYINGSLDTQATMTTNYDNTSRPFFLGHTPELSAGRDWNGYVDDFRITKGYARTITASPTAPFPVQ
jgi:hypothetical protein